MGTLVSAVSLPLALSKMQFVGVAPAFGRLLGLGLGRDLLLDLDQFAGLRLPVVVRTLPAGQM
jgi:hypothetical protein